MAPELLNGSSNRVSEKVGRIFVYVIKVRERMGLFSTAIKSVVLILIG